MVMEDIIALNKRRRELEEAEVDPDTFIERTLRDMSVSMADTTMRLAPDISRHLGYHFDPIVPLPVPDDPASRAISFTTPAPVVNPPVHPILSPDSTVEAHRAFDFDFFIDSSAAGFDDEAVATPDLVGTNEESPPSDDDVLPPLTLRTVFNANAGSSNSAAPMTGIESERKVEDYERWFALGGAPVEADDELPSSFSWDGDLEAGSWQTL